MREFDANYTATLENICMKKEKAMDMPNTDRMPLWGVMVDVSDHPINRLLHGENFIPPTTTPNLFHKISDKANQLP